MKHTTILISFLLFQFPQYAVAQGFLHLKVLEVEHGPTPPKKIFTVEISNSTDTGIFIKGLNDEWIATPILDHPDTGSKAVLMVPTLNDALGEMQFIHVSYWHKKDTSASSKDTLTSRNTTTKPLILNEGYYIGPNDSTEVKFSLFLNPEITSRVYVDKLKGVIMLVLNIDYYTGTDSNLYHTQIISEEFKDVRKVFY